MILNGLEAGQGVPVVLLHGLFGRAQNLGALARRLAASRRVISLDLRNHGASPHAPGMDYPSMADDVRQSLVERGAWPAHVLGHSMGGKVAMMLALTCPKEVLSLIVADIAPVAYQHRNREIARALQAIPLTPGLTRAEAGHMLAHAQPDPAVRGFLLQNLVISQTPHWRIGLSHIAGALGDIEGWPASADGLTYSARSSFLYGDRSDFRVAEQRFRIESYFPAACCVAIAGAGHWLHADQPEAFGAAVKAALA